MATEPSPPGSTREVILEAAIDLFTEQGFDKTSLREVAARVGVTKAALYYHFRSKEEILEAVMARLHGIGHHGLELLPVGEGAIDRERIMAACEVLLDYVLDQRKLFLLLERNRTAVEALSRKNDDAHQQEHVQLERRWREFATNGGVPLSDRVRISAAFGALMASAIGSSQSAVPEERLEIRREVLAMLSDMLALPNAPAPPGDRAAR
ncbi:MAG: TetR/AcrR family transcriptional regulator [Candidatus Dormibacteria bacterium]